ncbi:MAG TPA: hypothetical protein DER64_01300 [Planctomycetaceae bacterium]|nr:hypothetical protein [Planctomycetaceae bacterium]
MATPTTRTAIDASLMLLSIAGLLAGGIGCGGGDNLQEFDDAHIKPADPGAHDHHHHHHGEDHDAPHGGTLVALGEHQYHAEIAWDEKAKTITVYVLDGEAEKAVPIDAEEIVLAIGIGKDAETHKFTAKPQDNDADGKSSRFVTSDKALFDKFHDNESTSGQIDLPIGKKTFPVVVAHDDHDHDHDEKGDHKHDEKGEHKHDEKGEHPSPKKTDK